MNTTQPTPNPSSRFTYRPIEGPCHPGVVLDALLKSPGRLCWEAAFGRLRAVLAGLLSITVLSLLVYGLVAGSLTGGAQLWIAPLKILLGSLLCAVICLPSLYIFLCLGGADTSLRLVVGELGTSVALTALLLLGFSPVAWVFSQSTNSIALMAFLHIVFWSVAMGFGLSVIGRMQRCPVGSLALWRCLYIIVCLQMMTCLRPLLGPSETFLPKDKQFFLVHALQTLSATPPPGK